MESGVGANVSISETVHGCALVKLLSLARIEIMDLNVEPLDGLDVLAEVIGEEIVGRWNKFLGSEEMHQDGVEK